MTPESQLAAVVKMSRFATLRTRVEVKNFTIIR